MKRASNAEKGLRKNKVSNVRQKGVKCWKGSQIANKVFNVQRVSNAEKDLKQGAQITTKVSNVRQKGLK